MIGVTRRQLLTGTVLRLAVPTKLEATVPPIPLNKSVTITLDGAGNGIAQIGPANGGPPTWSVDSVIWVSNPGVAPIPTIQIFQDSVNDPSSRLAVDYDGSFGSAAGSNLVINRGQYLYVTFTAGNPGASTSVTVTGQQGTGKGQA